MDKNRKCNCHLRVVVELVRYGDVKRVCCGFYLVPILGRNGNDTERSLDGSEHIFVIVNKI